MYHYCDIFLDSLSRIKDKRSLSEKELKLLSDMKSYEARLSEAVKGSYSYPLNLDKFSSLRSLAKKFIPGAKVYAINKCKSVLVKCYEFVAFEGGNYLIVRLFLANGSDVQTIDCYPLSSTLLIPVEFKDVDVSELGYFQDNILDNLYSLKSSDEISEYANLYLKLRLLHKIESIKESIAINKEKITSDSSKLDAMVNTLSSLK